MAETKSILFKNFTGEEFVCSWNGVAYTFPPGREMYVEDWKAEHFAKHLVNRVMHQKGMITTNEIERNEFLKQALPSEETLTPEVALDMQAREAVAEVKKGRAKKVVEEEFEGLKS